MSDNQIGNLDLLDNLIIRGLNVILGGKKDSDLSKKIFSDHPDIVFSKLAFLESEIQNKIIEGVLAENASLFTSNDDWWRYIVQSCLRLESMSMEEFHPNSGLYVLLNRVRDLREDVDWFNIMLKLSESTTYVGSKCSGFMTVLGWLIQSDPENLRKLLYRTESKSYPASLKDYLYKKSIDLGLFDVKLARRVRSDSNGSLSSTILAYLFENRSLYQDEVFQDLVTQFSDTKHKWVARYIAMNMPMHLIPFLMGIKDDVALKILDKRMELSEGNYA
jgi:hypothetical protein